MKMYDQKRLEEVIKLGRIQRLCRVVMLFFLSVGWNDSVLSHKRFFFTSLDCIQDTSTVVFALDNIKI